MINISKAASAVPKISLQKQGKTIANPIVKTAAENVNLNNIPHYPIMPKAKSIMNAAQKALEEFKLEFGDVKSATYVCEEIKQAKKANVDNSILDALFNKRQTYSAQVKKMRKNFKQNQYKCFDDYINALKKYLHENGTYLNCNECADLTIDSLQKQGVKANNVLIYSTNKEGVRTSFLEHVFTLAGLEPNCDIANPSTWGDKAVICDAWAGKCLPAKDGINFYKEFFGTDDSIHNLMFEFCDKVF